MSLETVRNIAPSKAHRRVFVASAKHPVTVLVTDTARKRANVLQRSPLIAEKIEARIAP